MTFQDNGHHKGTQETVFDLVTYLGPIEPQPELQPEPQPEPEPQPVQVREGRWRTRFGDIVDVAPTPPEHDLADIYPWWDGLTTWRNDGRFSIRESATDLVEYLGPIELEPQPQPEPDAELQAQLAAVKAELATVAAERQRLQIDLDAAQQVPQAIADRFEEGWNQGTARAVETITAWLEPFNGCNSPALAALLIEALPDIMRHLTGLDIAEDVD